MKKLFLLVLICSPFILSQDGVFDEPIDSTTHYSLRKYAQSARVPAEILNEDKDIIDSVMYSLIVWVDTSQFVLVSDPAIHATALTLQVSNYADGFSSFSSTNTTDTFVVSTGGLDSAHSLIWLSPLSLAITSNDVLAYKILSATQVIVTRPASGTSGLTYVWRRIERY